MKIITALAAAALVLFAGTTADAARGTRAHRAGGHHGGRNGGHGLHSAKAQTFKLGTHGNLHAIGGGHSNGHRGRGGSRHGGRHR